MVRLWTRWLSVRRSVLRTSTRSPSAVSRSLPGVSASALSQRPWSSTQNGCSAVATTLAVLSPSAPSTSTVTSTSSLIPELVMVATTVRGPSSPVSGSVAHTRSPTSTSSTDSTLPSANNTPVPGTKLLHPGGPPPLRRPALATSPAASAPLRNHFVNVAAIPANGAAAPHENAAFVTSPSAAYHPQFRPPAQLPSPAPDPQYQEEHGPHHSSPQWPGQAYDNRTSAYRLLSQSHRSSLHHPADCDPPCACSARSSSRHRTTGVAGNTVWRP